MSGIGQDKILDVVVGIVVGFISKFIIENSEIKLLHKVILIVVFLGILLLIIFRKNIGKTVKNFERGFRNIEEVQKLKDEIETQRTELKLKIEEQQAEVYKQGKALEKLNETLGKIVCELIGGIDKLVLVGEGEKNVEQSQKDMLLSEVRELQHVFQDLQKLQNFTTEFSRDLDDAAQIKALNEIMSQEDTEIAYKLYKENQMNQEKIPKN